MALRLNRTAKPTASSSNRNRLPRPATECVRARLRIPELGALVGFFSSLNAAAVYFVELLAKKITKSMIDAAFHRELVEILSLPSGKLL